MIHKLRFLFCLLGIFTMASCGWHLRGTADLTGIDSVYITAQNPDSSFVTILKREFQANQVLVKTDANEGSYSIVIQSLREGRRTIGVDGSGKAAKYLLTQTVDYMVLDSQGKPITGKLTQMVEQTYDHDDNRALAKDNERRLLREEMYQNLALQMMRTLGRSVRKPAPK